MKKLISAAASLAMAATMVGSAVPFATGAADASKTLAIRGFEDADGNPAKLTITAADFEAAKAAMTEEDAKAAAEAAKKAVEEKDDSTPEEAQYAYDLTYNAAFGVKVPIGIYIVEGTNDCDSIAAQWTVNSKDGDASNDYVGLISHSVGEGESYYSSAKDFTLASGTATIDQLINFAGTVSTNRRGETNFEGTGGLTTFALPKSDSAGTPNAYGSLVWLTPTDGSGYNWTGAKSDDYPIYVQDVAFFQGTPSGTYTIDFLDYAPEADFPDNLSCMIEIPGSGRYTTKLGNLKLDGGLEIKIENDDTPKTTTTTAPAATTTAAPATTTAVVTTAGGNQGGEDDIEVAADFKVKAKDITVKPGDQGVELPIYITDKGAHKDACMLVLEVLPSDLPEGITVDEAAMAEDLTCYAVAGNKKFENINHQFFADITNSSMDPQVLLTEPDEVLYYILNVDENTAPGEYEFTMNQFYVVERSGAGDTQIIEFRATVEPSTIKVEGEVKETTTAAPATTTAAPATTTAAPATTATPVTTTAGPATTAVAGTPVYGDSNCDGKVNIADVVVLNKWRNDAKSYNLTDQGKLNADCCDPKNGTEINANDSDAIIKSIVHLVTLPTTAADLK